MTHKFNTALVAIAMVVSIICALFVCNDDHLCHCLAEKGRICLVKGWLSGNQTQHNQHGPDDPVKT
jgi:hypothetical protein